MEMDADGTVRKRPQPVFGVLSLIAFTASLIAGLFFIATANRTDPFVGMGLVILSGCGGSLVGWIVAAIGMFRREAPIWPAHFGFILCFGPAMIGIYVMSRPILDALGV